MYCNATEREQKLNMKLLTVYVCHAKSKVNVIFMLQVCTEAKCPNIGECWGGPAPTATIMVSYQW